MEGDNDKGTYDNSLDETVVGNRTFASTPSSSTSGCVSGDDTSEGKAVIPASLVTAENYLSISEVSYCQLSTISLSFIIFYFLLFITSLNIDCMGMHIYETLCT
jgi:hypothetical protein